MLMNWKCYFRNNDTILVKIDNFTSFQWHYWISSTSKLCSFPPSSICRTLAMIGCYVSQLSYSLNHPNPPIWTLPPPPCRGPPCFHFEDKTSAEDFPRSALGLSSSEAWGGWYALETACPWCRHCCCSRCLSLVTLSSAQMLLSELPNRSLWNRVRRERPLHLRRRFPERLENKLV